MSTLGLTIIRMVNKVIDTEKLSVKNGVNEEQRSVQAPITIQQDTNKESQIEDTQAVDLSAESETFSGARETI